MKEEGKLIFKKSFTFKIYIVLDDKLKVYMEEGILVFQMGKLRQMKATYSKPILWFSIKFTDGIKLRKKIMPTHSRYRLLSTNSWKK